jgi:hypothetical protein
VGMVEWGILSRGGAARGPPSITCCGIWGRLMAVHHHSRMRLQARSLTCGSQDPFSIDFWICLLQMPKQPFDLDLIDHSQQHTNLDFGPFSSIRTLRATPLLLLRVSVDRQPDSIIRSLSYKACMTTEPQTLILKRANCLQQIPADLGEAAGAFRVAVLLCLLVNLCLCSKPQFSVHCNARERRQIDDCSWRGARRRCCAARAVIGCQMESGSTPSMHYLSGQPARGDSG